MLRVLIETFMCTFIFNYLNYFILHDTCCQSTLLTNFLKVQNVETSSSGQIAKRACCTFSSDLENAKQ